MSGGSPGRREPRAGKRVWLPELSSSEDDDAADASPQQLPRDVWRERYNELSRNYDQLYRRLEAMELAFNRGCSAAERKERALNAELRKLKRTHEHTLDDLRRQIAALQRTVVQKNMELDGKDNIIDGLYETIAGLHARLDDRFRRRAN